MLTPDAARNAAFTDMQIISFKNGMNLKDHPVGAVLLRVDVEGIYTNHVGQGGGRSSEVCKSVNDTSHLKRRDTDDMFNTLKGPLDCNSNHIIVHLLECKQCQYRFSYVGSAKTKFRYRINNYYSIHRKFRKKYAEKDLAIAIKKFELKRKLFHEHYCSESHQGIEN